MCEIRKGVELTFFLFKTDAWKQLNFGQTWILNQGRIWVQNLQLKTHSRNYYVMCKIKRKEITKFFYVTYFRQKAFKTLDLFGVPFQTSLFYHYFLAYTVNILFKMLRLYIYTDQRNIDSSLNFNIYYVIFLLAACSLNSIYFSVYILKSFLHLLLGCRIK